MQPRCLRSRLAIALAITAAACVVAAAAALHAQGADDHSAAATLVRQLELDVTHGPITSAALAHARDELERAVRLRGTGDEAHARAADSLAREWAETARDLVRAVDAEAAAVSVRRKAVDAQGRVERERTLVETAILRVGRLTSELEAAGHARPADRTAIEVRDGGPSAVSAPPGPRGDSARDRPAQRTPAGERP